MKLNPTESLLSCYMKKIFQHADKMNNTIEKLESYTQNQWQNTAK